MSSEDEEDPLEVLKKCIEESKDKIVIGVEEKEEGVVVVGEKEHTLNSHNGLKDEEEEEEVIPEKKKAKLEATIILLNGPYIDPMDTILFEGSYKDTIDSLLHDKNLDTTQLRDGISLFIKRLVRRHKMDFGEDGKNLELSLDLEILISLLSNPLNQNGGLKEDLFMNIFNICHYLTLREYLKANDIYLKIAIGNMPWPLGVTAYGIHSRVADAKISVDNQTGHILNDPQSKRWIKALKRLITYTQSVYPPYSISKRMG